MVNRLYTTKKAGELLGGLHVNNVYRLIQQKKLLAKTMVVRGRNKHPRMYIAASEIERFIRELPTKGERAPRKNKGYRPQEIIKELEQARKYY